MPYALLIIVWLGLPLAALGQAASPTITHTPIESTRLGHVNDEALAEHWQLEADDLKKYRRFMALEGRYFYSHLDPIMVLGIIETDLSKRREYADKYLQGERRRVSEQISFATLVAARSLLLYGPESLFDFSSAPQAANSPGYLRARAERQAKELSRARRMARISSEPLPSLTLKVGDTVELLVTPVCMAPCYASLDRLLKTEGVQVEVYGRDFVTTDALIAWLGKWASERPQRREHSTRIQLKRFDPVIFSGFDTTAQVPLALVRRDGRVLGAL